MADYAISRLDRARKFRGFGNFFFEQPGSIIWERTDRGNRLDVVPSPNIDLSTDLSP